MKEKVEILEKTVANLTNKAASEKTEQLEKLEKVVHALVRKVLSLESEVDKMKSKAGTDMAGIEKDSSFNINDIKCCSSTPKNVKEKEKK